MDHRPKKDVQLESCELGFIWDKMRTAAWEVAPQMALRDCSTAAVLILPPKKT